MLCPRHRPTRAAKVIQKGVSRIFSVVLSIVDDYEQRWWKTAMPMGRDAWGHGCSISDSRNQDLTFKVKLTALPWLISLSRLSDRSR